MQKQPFVDGVKSLSTSPPRATGKARRPGGFAFLATVTFASFVSGSLVVMVIAISMPFGYTCLAISGKERTPCQLLETYVPSFPYEQAELTKRDYVICCGDLGGVWDGSAEEQGQLDWLENRPFTTLFVSGNHENFDLRRSIPPKNGTEVLCSVSGPQ